MTSDGEGSNTSVMGHCMASTNHNNIQNIMGPHGNYYKILSDRSAQDNKTCSQANRHGRLCSQCKPHHVVSAYSYLLKCYNCTSSTLNSVLQYIACAFLPLTIFLAVVLLFRITITSPAMNVPVFCCQIFSSPFFMVMFLSRTVGTGLFAFSKFIATVYGIWNLDFFRALVPPICLPLTTLQIIVLDYLVAVYPLFLLICFYLLVTTYGKGFRPLVLLCRPLRLCTKQLRGKWYIKRTIKDAFITFLLLSYIKLLNTSFRLLSSTVIHDEYGKRHGRFLIVDARIKVMSTQHLPYAILAISTLLLLIVMPTLLQLLYPMLWFQRFLNRCGLNSPGLRLCMESFQGYYRDRADGGWECRYFSVLYPSIRIIVYAINLLLLNTSTLLACSAVSIATAAIILIVRPYKAKYKIYNTSDALLMLVLAVFPLVLLESVLYSDMKQLSNGIGGVVCGALVLTPLLYFTVRSIHYIYKQICALIAQNTCIRQGREIDVLIP